MADQPLVLVSNRGPVTFGPGGEIKRGTGGLVTALIGLASHREVTWVASAMTDEDVEAAERHEGKPFAVEAPEGDEYMVKMVASDGDAYDRFYNIIANPMLWFIQHYLWDLSNAPDIRRNETEAFEFGYNAVNEDLARAVLEEIEGIEDPVVMVHDYHLYTLPGLIRRERPDAFLHHFVARTGATSCSAAGTSWISRSTWSRGSSTARTARCGSGRIRCRSMRARSRRWRGARRCASSRRSCCGAGEIT
jgi:trehalose 6-phosphate synthase